MTTQTQTRPVASRAPSGGGEAQRVNFQYHPRLIRALGAELVTSDIVAIIELVKNSYDAFAHNVTIRFAEDAQGEYIEIEDDGLGMTRDVIMDAWFTVATPHKVSHSTARLGARQRRVSGDKGLGRLSAARLGDRFEMITKAHGDRCWKVEVHWSGVTGDGYSSESAATISEVNRNEIGEDSGTQIRISDLNTQWTGSSVSDLRESLARLISPFGNPEEFKITLESKHTAGRERVSIESPGFLSYPPYKVEGSVDAFGNVTGTYIHAQHGETIRHKDIKLQWSEILDFPIMTLERSKKSNANCGPFSFEIRVWDLNPDERRNISERYTITVRDIQRAINSNKGISLYRDGVLVLPKTDHAKDWLGLDERRIRRVGPRIGTRNVIGQVHIRSDSNPDIKDTSDREALANNPATDEFRSILMAVVSRLESERNSDRATPPRRLNDVFSAVTADSVLRRARSLERQNASVSAIVPAIERHAEQLIRTQDELRERFVYYSRVAALGQMAHMLVHEVRNRTTSIGAFLRRASATLERTNNRTLRLFELANGSVRALEALADKLAPLASRSFRRSRSSVIEHQMRECVGLLADSLQVSGVHCEIPESETRVAVDPGELTHVFYNLIDNSAYWLRSMRDDEKIITLRISAHRDPEKVTVRVEDNGPGIDEDNEERVFLPGFTMKPHGTGMGLTVASELVAAWGGNMAFDRDVPTNGACFAFDAPLVPQANSKTGIAR